MTRDRHEADSVQDMTFVLAQDRIDDLRASASTIDAEPAAAAGGQDAGHRRPHP